MKTRRSEKVVAAPTTCHLRGRNKRRRPLLRWKNGSKESARFAVSSETFPLSHPSMSDSPRSRPSRMARRDLPTRTFAATRDRMDLFSTRTESRALLTRERLAVVSRRAARGREDRRGIAVMTSETTEKPAIATSVAKRACGDSWASKK